MNDRGVTSATPLYYERKEMICTKVLAIDQARHGAWSLYDSDTRELLKYGIFEFDKPHTTYAKVLVNTETLLEALIQEHQPDYIAIEDIQLRVSTTVFKKLAWLQGVLVHYCEKHKLSYGLIMPTRWQKYCRDYLKSIPELMNNEELHLKCPTKGASKLLSLTYVRERFGIVTNNDNLADAICIGHYVTNEVDLHSDNAMPKRYTKSTKTKQASKKITNTKEKKKNDKEN